MTKIGILHPGEMGVSVAASASNSGHSIYWASEQRSENTYQRAKEHSLIDTGSISELCSTCDIILSICPPHAAEDVARLAFEAGFKGFYLDANAISPQRAVRIGRWLSEKDIYFIDGGIIGGPAWKPGETCLFLSGKHAKVIADCFKNGPLETRILGDEVGKASALKMCYAAYSKGTTALLASILATAESLGVREELYGQWDADERGFSEQVNRRVTRSIAKAWRFEGEMNEIAATFREAGLPSGFHEAAAEVYHRMSNLKNDQETDSVGEIIASITRPSVHGASY
jgi:3-hydroxyisobutyrate dehydrogenase-like beta-hydroxyacid dehydrogenase